MRCPICQKEGCVRSTLATDYLVTYERFPLLKCTHCGFIYTGDAPMGDQIGAYYKSQDYISHSDTRRSSIDRIYHLARRIMLRVKKRQIKRYISNKQKPSPNLLDIGCGTGYFAHYMTQAGYAVSCVEKDADARDFARRNHFLVPYPSLEELPTEANSFDVITLWHVLEHIETLDEHFTLIERLLKQDGLLVIALPNRTGFDAKFYKNKWAAYDVPRHLWHFAPNDIQQLAHRYGFKLRAVHPMYFDAFYISFMSERQKGTRLLIAIVRALVMGAFCFTRSLINSPYQASSLTYYFVRQ